MREKIATFRERYKRFEPVAFFTAGFLFDVMTLRRIDDWLKLGFQVAFILLLGWLLLLQHRESKGGLHVPARLAKVWRYQVDIVHFLFGSLLSAYVIFYFKSASATRSGLFLLFLILLLILNEVPRIRELGIRLRVSLFGFCLTSFLIYFLPLLAGYISTFLFVSAIFLATLGIGGLLRLMAKEEAEPRRVWVQMGIPALAIQIILLSFYFLKVIPPVPLSVTFAGIYHKVEKQGGITKLYSMKPWYDFWSHGEKTFRARGEEPVYCFVRIYSPTKFTHKIYLRWRLYNEKLDEYVTQDRIGMQISGGREDGFRGYAYKSNYQPGDWRLDIETEDSRVLGEINFSIETDPTTEDRIWMIEEG